MTTWYLKRYYNKDALQNDLPRLLPLARRALEFAHTDCNEANVYNVIMSGHADVWSGWINDRLCSMLVCYSKDRGTIRPSYLVYLLASDTPMPKEIYAEGLKQIEDRAKQLGCTEIEMYTKRERAFQRILEPYGWTAAYTVFTKEVE
jgi:hypothetical protein